MQSHIRAGLFLGVVALSVGVLTAIGCGGGGAGGLTVEGFVVDSQSGNPVQNAYVYVPTSAITSHPRGGRQVPLQTYTNAQGYFGFPNFPADLAAVVTVQPAAGFDPTPVRLNYGQSLGQLGTMDLRVTVRLLAADLVGNLSDIIVNPGTSTLAPGDKVAYSAQFIWSGTPPATIPHVTWSTEGGVGLIDETGLFRAGQIAANGYAVATLGPFVRKARVVVQAGTPPQLEVTPTAVDFGNLETEKTIAVTNSAGGTLEWSIWPLDDSATWLSCSPRSGSLGPGQSATVRLVVSRTSLEPGTYRTVLRVSSNGGYVDVTATVSATGAVAGTQAPVRG